MKKLFTVIMCFVSVCAAVFGAGKSQAFPSKQIDVIVGFNPGGASDIATRFIAKEVEDILKVPLVVNNKPGGTSAVAFEYLASQPADGYTVMYMSVETAMLKPTGLSNLEPKDVRFITRAIMSTPVLVVNKSSPWNTLQEFINYCKANPGKVTLANAGPGAFTHYACVGLEQAAGITFNYVPFDGGAASATAAMGGHVDAAACVSTEARAGVESGTLKVLASLGDVRSSLYPEVPTLKEFGINVGIPGWGCFGVPKNTPDDVVKVLEDAFVKAVQSQGFADMCKTNDWAPSPLSANEAQVFANNQAENFQVLAKLMGVK